MPRKSLLQETLTKRKRGMEPKPTHKVSWNDDGAKSLFLAGNPFNSWDDFGDKK